MMIKKQNTMKEYTQETNFDKYILLYVRNSVQDTLYGAITIYDLFTL